MRRRNEVRTLAPLVCSEGVEMDLRSDLRHSPAIAATPGAAAIAAPNESPQSSMSWSAVVTIVAAVLVQLIASAVGGYVAGRLRTKWVQVHDDEVYFRDTAHGVVVWALATLVTAGFLTSAASTAIGAGTSGIVAAAVGNAQPPMAGEAPAAMPAPSATSAGAPPTPPPAPTASQSPSIPPRDLDRARSVAAQTALWSVLALLVGAFSASVAATIGGRQRDRLAVALRDT
jgi:hypothetical protein